MSMGVGFGMSMKCGSGVVLFVPVDLSDLLLYWCCFCVMFKM